MISQDFKEHLEIELGNHFNSEIKIEKIVSENGGDINEAFQLQCNKGDFFVKVNDANAFPLMFEAEVKGLALLSERSSFIIPKPIVAGKFHNKAYLILEYLALQSTGNWTSFGEQLASLHQNSSSSFGLDHSNYIGSLVQENRKMDTWADFYIEQRLAPLAIKASSDGFLDSRDLKYLDSLYKHLASIYPIEKPALLHGDLWSGNASFCNASACVFDPAVYYGHREMDLGMTLLFGGFPDEMYSAYNSVYPFEKGWRRRVEISQLYPLLVHIILFGGSYVNQLRAILKKY